MFWTTDLFAAVMRHGVSHLTFGFEQREAISPVQFGFDPSGHPSLTRFAHA